MSVKENLANIVNMHFYVWGGGCPYHYLLGENISCKLYRKAFDKEVNLAYAKYNK